MSPTVIAAAFLAVIVWGASPVATKIAVSDVPPLVVAFLRTVLGGSAALPIILALRLPPPEHLKQRLLLALSGFCGFIAFPVLFSIGQQRTSAIHGAMILAILPVMTGIFAMAWDRRMPHHLFWIGCAVAVSGEAVLTMTRQGSAGGQAGLVGDLLVFLSASLASVGYVAGARLQQSGYPSRGATFWGAVLASALLLPAWPWISKQLSWSAVTWEAWGGIAYLAIGVTIIGYVLWYWALGRGGIAKIGLFQFFQPVSGLVLAWLLLREPLSFGLVVAALLIALGLALAWRGKSA